MVTRKVKTNGLSDVIGNRLNDLQEVEQEEKQPAKIDIEPAKPSTPATSEKKVLTNFKVNESTLKSWKQFCLNHDTNLTDTIKRAMSYYIKNVNNGNIDL